MKAYLLFKDGSSHMEEVPLTRRGTYVTALRNAPWRPIIIAAVYPEAHRNFDSAVSLRWRGSFTDDAGQILYDIFEE